MELTLTAEIQRSLGRIEGAQTQQYIQQGKTNEEMVRNQEKIFSLLGKLSDDLNDHKGEDRQSFQIVSSRMASLERSTKANDELEEKKEVALKAMDEKLQTLNAYVDNIKGAWWLITILIAIVAGFGALAKWCFDIWNARHGG